MKVKSIPKNIDECIQQQILLSKKVVTKDCFEKIDTVGGIDVHYFGDNVVVGYTIFSYSEIRLIYSTVDILHKKYNFDYRPEFLCFSEGVYIIEFLSQHKQTPDVLILDGHGVAHPRKLGVASYVGVVLDIPTIGCAKSLLYGKYSRKNIKLSKGSFAEVKDENGDVIGIALRTKDNVKEIIISVGHKISLFTAKDIVLRLSVYRIPEPLRVAHILAKNFYK